MVAKIFFETLFMWAYHTEKVSAGNLSFLCLETARQDLVI